MNLKFVLFLNLFSFISFGQTTISNNSEIKSYLDSITNEDFSGTILVAKNNEIIEKRACGFSNKEFKVENNFDTKFNIASITKMFTSVAILQLFQQGKIELHQPIGKYLNNYPNKSVRDSVTIHHLLTHTAGTGSFYGEKFSKTDKLRYKEIIDFVPLFVNDSLLFTPGSKYHYNGSGFVILGLIIEKVSGQNYYDYLTKNIFIPAEMNNTAALEIDSIVTNKASGYTQHIKKDKTLIHNYYYLAKASPAADYYSTIEDLFRFSKSLRNYTLLNKETTELMFEPKVKGYNTNLGYGIDVDLRYNQPILGHTGGWYGVRGELMDFMESGYTIVILSNVDDDGTTGTTKISDYLKNLIAKNKYKK